jgi:hypothetical protein
VSTSASKSRKISGKGSWITCKAPLEPPKGAFPCERPPLGGFLKPPALRADNYSQGKPGTTEEDGGGVPGMNPNCEWCPWNSLVPA